MTHTRKLFSSPVRSFGLFLFALILLALMTLLQSNQRWIPIVGAQVCGKTDTYVAVWEVQGSGSSSPLVGQRGENIRGVVTADFQQGTGGPFEPWGFYIQAHEPDCDPATSDGLFVYTGSSPKPVEVGDLIEIDKTIVLEHQGPATFIWDDTLTELSCTSRCVFTTLQPGYGVPPAEEYDPPADDAAAADYNEAREGMLMQVSEAGTVISPANAFNEFVMLRGAGQDRLHREDTGVGQRIMVDGDGVSAAQCGQDGFGYIKTFDTIDYNPASGQAIFGPLTYNFNMYKIQQDDDSFCIGHTPGDGSSYDPAQNPAPASDADTLTVASINAWNFFDTSNDNTKEDETGISTAEYDQASLKRADLVCSSLGLNLPHVVALQEIENDTVLQKLVNDISTLCGGSYDFHTLAGPDDRGIEVSFLTRADQVTVVAVNDRQSCSSTNWGVDYEPGDHPADVVCSGGEPFYLHNRPPLEMQIELDLNGATETIYLINNHFKSKLTNTSCTLSDCTDWRVEQAQHVDALVDGILVGDPGAHVIVLGDLNDFYESAPLDELDLTFGSLTNVMGDLQGPPSTGQGSIGRYTFIFNGVSQTLDHVLLSDSLSQLARTTSVRHVNTDWPATHITSDNTLFRSSDHDGIVVGIHFGEPGAPTPTPTTTPILPTPTPTPVLPTPTATPVIPPTATSTPTPIPPPTFTPTPGGSTTAHVGDLDQASTSQGASWTGDVTITVHDENEIPVTGVLVSGTWSRGVSGSSSCTTDASGQCTVSQAGISNSRSGVLFIVDDLESGLVYDPAANHDPDGDSDGQLIVVMRP